MLAVSVFVDHRPRRITAMAQDPRQGLGGLVPLSELSDDEWRAIYESEHQPMLIGMTRKIAISLADDLLAAVDAESRVEHLSRSGFFATAAQDYLEKVRRQREVDAYVASYRDLPESDEELAITDAFLSRSFGGE
jgi:hypothetical protein